MRIHWILFAAFFSVFSPTTLAATCNIVNGKAYGNCMGVAVGSRQKGTLTITSSVVESGIIDGAVVKKGGSLLLSGISVGDITVEAGAFLEVGGIVNGLITNNGGKIRIDGTAQSVHVNSGTLDVSGVVDYIGGNGSITYQKGAVIGGKAIQ